MAVDRSSTAEIGQRTAAANESPVRLSPYARSLQARKSTPAIGLETTTEPAIPGNRPNQRALQIAEAREAQLQEGRTGESETTQAEPAVGVETPDDSPKKPKQFVPHLTPADIDQLLASKAARAAMKRVEKRETPFADRRQLAQEPPTQMLVRGPLKTIRPGTPNEQAAPAKPAPVAAKPKGLTPERFAQATRKAAGETEELRRRKGLKK